MDYTYLASYLKSAGISSGIAVCGDGTVLGKENLTTDQVAALDAAIAAYDPLPYVKDAKILAARDACQAALASLATRFSDLERQTWGPQLSEAQAILQDSDPTAVKYPVIGGIIAVTGEAWGDFAAAVIANNETWSRASAPILGQRQKIVAQIKACTTVAEVEAVSTEITVGS